MRLMDSHEHPVQFAVVNGDLQRSRVTVFFRLILAIPHLIWFVLWSIVVLIVAILNWFATLAMGQPPGIFHRFLCAYIRYTIHLGAYLTLVADPYPGFTGEAGSYPIDISLPTEPQVQSRWKTLLRLILAIHALFIGSFLGGGFGFSTALTIRGGGGGGSSNRINAGAGFWGGGLLASVCAFLGWFAALATGRMPSGLRDAGAYGLGYGGQVRAYALLLTDRYPNTDPTTMLESAPRPAVHPVHLVGDAQDLRRSRLMVFFRLPLSIPLFIWFYLWSWVALVVVIINWFATLIMGRPPRLFQRFLGAFVRFQFHVYAFFTVAANPYPGFTGKAGSYPLDLALPVEPQRQNRWKTLFRAFLIIPAAFVGYALSIAMYVASVFTWFVALFTGSAPWGLRNLMAYALRYLAQINAYIYLLTDAYPHASPLEGAPPPPAPEALESGPLASGPLESEPPQAGPPEPQQQPDPSAEPQPEQQEPESPPVA